MFKRIARLADPQQQGITVRLLKGTEECLPYGRVHKIRPESGEDCLFCKFEREQKNPKQDNLPAWML